MSSEKQRKYAREWARRNKDATNARRRKKRADPVVREHEWRRNRLLKFKLTERQLTDIWEAQGRQCFICQQPFDNPFAGFIDHSHKTGDVRGLLCSQCNTGLGMFRDSVTNLARAIQYLQHHVEDLL